MAPNRTLRVSVGMVSLLVIQRWGGGGAEVVVLAWRKIQSLYGKLVWGLV